MFNIVEKDTERLKSLNIIYFFLKSNKNFQKIFDENTDEWCLTLDKNSEIIYIDAVLKDCKNISHGKFLQNFYFEENCSIKQLLEKMYKTDLDFLKQKLNNIDLSFMHEESPMYNNGIRLHLVYIKK
jgi:hypothetical protein